MDESFESTGDQVRDLKELRDVYTNVLGTSGFVERYFDPGLRLSNSVSKASLVSGEIERLTSALAVIIVVESIPRRLGGNATDEELALDKKRSRRVIHALNQSLSGWSKKQPKIKLTPETERDGAQLEWEQFYPEHMTQLNSELRIVSTWSIQNDEARWGRSAVVNLENEMRWLRYALRD
jgi:hypothetical protein